MAITLLELPVPLLVHVLSFLTEERLDHFKKLITPAGRRGASFRNALMVCKALRQACDAVPPGSVPARLSITDEKLQKAKSVGLVEDYLQFCSTKAQLWQRTEVDVQHEEDMNRVLQSLGSLSGSAGSGSRLVRLKLWFANDNYGRPSFPTELCQLTLLTYLKILHRDYTAPLRAAQLTALSSLTALQSLKIDAPTTRDLAASALQNLQQLTRLWMRFWDPSERLTAPALCCAQISTLTALRRLDLYDFGLSLAEEVVLTAWQHMENLTLSRTASRQDAAGLWGALWRLPRLTSLVSDSVGGQPSKMLRSTVSDFPQLAKLRLLYYSEPALPQPLPTTLTSLDLYASDVRVVPTSPTLLSLSISKATSATLECPGHLLAMTQLTELILDSCHLSELPAPLAALPALEKLSLSHNDLTDLPQDLACVGCLRGLVLYGNLLQWVPRVLCTGAASRLEYLNIRWTRGHPWEVDEVALRSSLPALTNLQLPDVRVAHRGRS